jgi:hypothetical protein
VFVFEQTAPPLLRKRHPLNSDGCAELSTALRPGAEDVKLYRIEKPGKRLFLQAGPPSMFSERHIVQSERGGGNYAISLDK